MPLNALPTPRPLTATLLLDVWERGDAQPAARQALALLQTVWPDMPVDALAALNIGCRDAALLALRRRLFGTTVLGLVTCPACGVDLELAVNIDDLLTASPPVP